MRVNVSEKLCMTFKQVNKNMDYSLRSLVDSLDPVSCPQLIALADSFELGAVKVSCDISDDTIDTINQLFGKCDNNTVELLIWISAFLPEI